MKPETALRQRVERALTDGGIGIEPVESGAVNPGFPDLLLSVFGADGLIPMELKIGEISEHDMTLRITYRADQMAKHYDLRRRLRYIWTLIYEPKTRHYFLIRDYRAGWPVSFLEAHSKWHSSNLKTLAEFIMKEVKERHNHASAI